MYLFFYVMNIFSCVRTKTTAPLSRTSEDKTSGASSTEKASSSRLHRFRLKSHEFVHDFFVLTLSI